MRFNPDTAAIVSLFISCAIACALMLLFAVRLVYRHGPQRLSYFRWMQISAAYVLLAVAAIVGFSFFAHILGFFTCLVIFVILVMAYNQHLANQRLALLELVALAAEKQVPLVPTITAFAYERGGRYGWRANQLARNLEAGQPLSQAIAAYPRVFPPATLLAASMGETTGKLGEALRELATRDAFQPPTWRLSLGRFLYLSWFVLAFAPLILSFLSIKVGPMMQKIFADFGAELPPLSQMALRIGGNPTAATVMLLCVIAGNIWCLLLAVAYMFGLRISPLGTGWFTRGMHTAVVLRALALGARAQRALPDVLGALIANYPSRSIRNRLQAAQKSIAQGVTWTESLKKQGIIRRADAAVLTSAQRVGNLPWALQEMADSNERRLNYRLETIVQIAFPVCMVVVGAAVAFFVVGYFLPLVYLITDLAQ